MKLALAQILITHELELVDNGEIRPQRRSLVTGPNRPIKMVVKSKRPVKSRLLQEV
jgi:cytochrome P450 family 110